MREVQTGSISAFETLVRRWEKPLISFVHRIVNNRHESEDIVQDTLFSIYRGVDRIDTAKKFSSYLFTAAKNTALSHIRKHKITVPLNEHVAGDDDETLYDHMEKEETSKQLREIMQKLDLQYRQPLELYYFFDLSYEEISRKLQIPLNTVKTNIRRGKEALKELLWNTHG